MFALNFSNGFLMNLAIKMKEKRLGPEEVIYNELENSQRIYFLMKGDVDIFVNTKD